MTMMSRRGVLQLSCCVIPLRIVPSAATGDERDPWNASELMDAAALADRLKNSGEPIHTICVAFPVLFRQRHIAGAVLAGPTSKPEGLEQLHSTLETLKKTDPVVLYCGCCPMRQCPNIRPAYVAARKAEFKNIRVLNLPTNFHTDWTAKGFPVAEG